MKIKILSILIIVVMILSQGIIFAEGNISWSFDSGVLKISGTGEMEDFTKDVPTPWQELKNEITKIEIAEGITKVGDWSFWGLSNLRDVSFSSTVEVIGERAFYECTELEYLKFGDSIKTIETGAFNSCQSIIRIEFGQGLELIEKSAFMNLPKLTSVTIPENVKHLDNWVFNGCTKLESVYFEGDIPVLGQGVFAQIYENYKVYYPEAKADSWKDFSKSSPEGILPYNPQDRIRVYLDNSEINFDQQPIIVNGRTLVPVRAIFEAMGGVVGWDAENSTVVAERDGVVIKMPIDSNVFYRNDEAVTLDTPAQIVNSRTLVPARAVSESFGAEVSWNDSERAVYIEMK